jgi:asparagine synthase (glutamine-hydrolysing)
METLLYGCSSRNLNRDFIACYLAGQSIGDLTPYRGIDAVTPSHYIVFRDGKFTRKPHWQWMITNTIRCKNDSEYEEHFRSLFRQSIERRTGPGAPILGELSGGMDSTSVLSMSDKVQASRNPPRAQTDSISYYDDSEPAWNERPYFSLVERARGKTGIHVDASLIPQTFRPHDGSLGEYLFPGADSSSIERERRFESLHQANRYRAILSGIGGDELLGGVPTPHPELAGYLASGDLSRFLRASIEWSITNRTSIVQTVAETLRFATGLYQSPAVRLNEIPGWMTPELRRSCIGSHANILPKRLIGFPPNSINNACTWWKMLETLPHRFPRLLTRREWRYPYLDRDLVDFLFSVPRSQLLRPGRRRSLMRRALKDIVPAEILERRRKAVVVRGPFISIQRNAPVIEHLFSDSLSADYGFIDPIAVRTLLNLVMIGKDPSHCAQLMRAISMELWLVSLASNGTRHPMLRIQDRDCPPVREQKTSA